MTYKDIASVSGKGGLFKIIKPMASGMILESIDSQKNKSIAGIHSKVSVLDEISVYVTDSENTVPLKDVLKKIAEEFGDDPGVDKQSSPEELKSFFAHVVPTYDKNKVYVSDIKKIVTWYSILSRELPELISLNEEEEASGDKS